MLRAFHVRQGLDYVALRYMNVYGPRQDYHGAYVAVVMKILDRIKESEDYIESLDKRQQAIIDGLDEAVSQLQSSINAIPDADLSGIEQSIKQIKPTNVTEIEKQVQSLSLAIGELKAIEPQKVDLQPLLDAINAPRTDTINLVTDNHGFPTKAIIERNGD